MKILFTLAMLVSIGVQASGPLITNGKTIFPNLNIGGGNHALAIVNNDDNSLYWYEVCGPQFGEHPNNFWVQNGENNDTHDEGFSITACIETDENNHFMSAAKLKEFAYVTWLNNITLDTFDEADWKFRFSFINCDDNTCSMSAYESCHGMKLEDPQSFSITFDNSAFEKMGTDGDSMMEFAQANIIDQFPWHPRCSTHTVPNMLVEPIPQSNGWKYAIWEQFDSDVNVYTQDLEGKWWTVTETYGRYEPNCLSEQGNMDKIRMALDDMVSGELAQVKPWRPNDCLSDAECADWEREQEAIEPIKCLVPLN